MNYRKTRTKHGRTMPGGAAHPQGRRLAAAFCLLTALMLPLCGCESYSTGDGMANAYYLDPGKDLQAIGRVALMELDSRSGAPNISVDMTEALYLAIQKRQIFGVQVVRQGDADWRSSQENLDSFEALRQLPALRDTLGCNGLLMGTITQYQPYPHMVIGLRLKLLDLADGRLIWAAEQVWDSSDKNVQKRIETHFRKPGLFTSPSLQEEMATVSFLSFARFVAYEIAETLKSERQ